MSYSNSELYEKIKKIHQVFFELSFDYSGYAMQSRPSRCYLYNDMASHFEEGAKACVRFLANHDLLQLVKDLNERGFYYEVRSLKPYTEDPFVLEEIKEAEDLSV